MGQVLSEPITQKHSAAGADERLAFGVSEMQGWRLTMEDAHAHVLDLDNKSDQPETQVDQRRSYFGVYDGHGGATVARYAGDSVHTRMLDTEPYKAKNWQEALKRTFLGTDEDMRANTGFNGEPSGCTAVAVFISEDHKIICANAGDSRAVISVNGEAEALSHDHKPVNKSENARIVAAGGYVEFGRVNGNLALSRALGDFEFKRNTSLSPEDQVVTANPDLIVHEPIPEDEFVVLACDGIWDVMSSQHVVDYVRRSIQARKPLDTICEEIMEHCLAPDSDCSGIGCDNMTVMVVALLRGKTVEQWYDSICDKLEKGQGYKTPTLEELPVPFKTRPAGQGGVGIGGGGGGGSLGSVLSGNSLFYNRGGGAGGGSGGEDDSDEEDNLLSKLQTALEQQGIRIVEQSDHDEGDEAEIAEAEEEDSDAEMTNASSGGNASDKDTSNTSSEVNGEVSHPAVAMEGLTDKSEDPTRTQA